MVTGVGYDARSTNAAIRCGIAGFDETKFMVGGEWLIGCGVPFKKSWRGREKLLQMIVPAIRECMAGSRVTPREVPILLCLAEEPRPGRFAMLDDSFLREVQLRLGESFHGESSVIAEGRVGGVKALARARELLSRGRPHCIVAGVDTYLNGATLAAYADRRRLLTAAHAHGFIPGEAAAAILLGPPRRDARELHCVGVGFGTEPAPVGSEAPLRADGLVEAIRAAFSDAGLGYEHLDFRIADVSGEQYGFKEAALALLRTMRVRKEQFTLWHPADCVGEVGAAIVPLVLGLALASMSKGYAPGAGALCHFANDDSQRASIVLRYQSGSPS